MEGIKLEAGKYYRTRDGRKAYVMGRNPLPVNCEEETWVGVTGPSKDLDGEMEDVATTWNDVGRQAPDGTTPHDLVAEWKEPKRIKGWGNVYLTVAHQRDGSCYVTGLWETRKEADQRNAERNPNNRIACIEIDVLEGQGLDGSAR